LFHLGQAAGVAGTLDSIEVGKIERVVTLFELGAGDGSTTRSSISRFPTHRLSSVFSSPRLIPLRGSNCGREALHCWMNASI
jgi:trans-aconitate methyltransferase